MLVALRQWFPNCFFCPPQSIFIFIISILQSYQLFSKYCDVTLSARQRCVCALIYLTLLSEKCHCNHVSLQTCLKNLWRTEPLGKPSERHAQPMYPFRPGLICNLGVSVTWCKIFGEHPNKQEFYTWVWVIKDQSFCCGFFCIYINDLCKTFFSTLCHHNTIGVY